MAGNCFPVDINGNEIVQFSEQPVDRSFLLIPHRIIAFSMCIFGLTANLLLIAIINVNANLLCNLRGIVRFSTILDSLYILVTFLVLPFVYTTHGRSYVFPNHVLYLFNRPISAILVATMTVFSVIAWSLPSFQFIYRYHLVKYRSAPQSFRLFVYLLIPIWSSVVYAYISLKSMNMFHKPSENVLNNRELALKHFGFDVDRIHIFETDNKSIANLIPVFGATMLLNYLFIVYFSFRIRQLLRSGPIISENTRKMNRDMDRMLLFNAICPVIVHILPFSYIAYAILNCNDHPFTGFLCAIPNFSSFIFSPISTVWFIRPYRRTVQRWLGRKSTVVDAIWSVTAITHQVTRRSSVRRPSIPPPIS